MKCFFIYYSQPQILNMYPLKLRPFVEQNRDKIDWGWLSENPSPGAVHLLEPNQKKINWRCLAANPGAIATLFEQNQDKIDWMELSRNPSPGAISILKQNQNKIVWFNLSCNLSPEALDILEKNPDRICWEYLSANPAIFTYDYDEIKKHMFESGIAEQLMQNRFHPKNLDKFEGWGFDSILSEI
jgi:hypothetical protein